MSKLGELNPYAFGGITKSLTTPSVPATVNLLELVLSKFEENKSIWLSIKHLPLYKTLPSSL